MHTTLALPLRPFFCRRVEARRVHDAQEEANVRVDARLALARSCARVIRVSLRPHTHFLILFATSSARSFCLLCSSASLFPLLAGWMTTSFPQLETGMRGPSASKALPTCWALHPSQNRCRLVGMRSQVAEAFKRTRMAYAKFSPSKLRGRFMKRRPIAMAERHLQVLQR